MHNHRHVQKSIAVIMANWRQTRCRFEILIKKKSCPGVAQRVEIGIAPRLVTVLNAVALRIHLQTRRTGMPFGNTNSRGAKSKGRCDFSVSTISGTRQTRSSFLFFALASRTTTNGRSLRLQRFSPFALPGDYAYLEARLCGGLVEDPKTKMHGSLSNSPEEQRRGV